jgi:apolipoprotein D and lipocalin family protein
MRFARSVGGILLLGILAACTGRPEGIEPVRGFDIERYTGTWYEIMRLDHSFERGLTNVTATYTLEDNGKVGVVNRGFSRDDCEWDVAEGSAEFQGSPDVASLSVTFQWPFAGGYHVFELDKPGYGYALVSGPNRDFLWLLAREPDLAVHTRSRLVEIAREKGFPVEELILVDHSAPVCAREG